MNGAAARVACSLVAISAAARANGAFPDEFSVHFPPDAPHRILLGANFGLIVSEDDGATWRYACEPYVTTGSSAALSTANVGFYQVTQDGAVLADAIQLTRSADVGCTWPYSGGTVAPPAVVSDIFADPRDATLAFAIVTSISGTAVVASHDGGQTFGAPLRSTSDILTGVESAASKAGVIYATSLATNGGATLLRSDDGGTTWRASSLGTSTTAQPRILAVAPDDENTVYVRMIEFPNDSILVTTDGGTTFSEVLVATGQLSAFALGSDGALYAGTLDGNFYARPAGATAFERRAGPRLRCLGQRPGTSRLYACGDMNLDGFSLGVSDDGGHTFQKVMTFREILGPLTCATVQDACAAHWARIRQVLGIAGGDGGVQSPPPPQKSGCASAPGGPFVLLSVLLALRRSRRRPSHPCAGA